MPEPVSPADTPEELIERLRGAANYEFGNLNEDQRNLYRAAADAIESRNALLHGAGVDHAALLAVGERDRRQIAQLTEGHHDLHLALSRLYDAVRSENFSRPARAPAMSTNLRVTLENASKTLRGADSYLAAARDERQENYDGPKESIECAHPGCPNRLLRSSFNAPQFCSRAHRDAAVLADEEDAR